MQPKLQQNPNKFRSGSDNIASKCYDLVATKSKAEQRQLYKMLQEMDKYKNQ